MRLPAFTRYALVLFAGPLVWAMHFLAIYGFTGVVCARGGAQAAAGVPLLVWGMLGLGALAFALLALAMRARPREGDEADAFLRRVALGLAWLAVAAIVLESLAVVFFPGCTGGA